MNLFPVAPALRFALACAVLLPLMSLAGTMLLANLLPTFHWMIGLIDDHYRILHLGLAVQGADSVIRLDVALQRPVLVGGHLVIPDARGHAYVTTLTGHVLQALVMYWAILLAWPARTWRETALRGGCALAFGWLLATVDVPFVLTGEVWALFVERHAPAIFSPLLAWKDFLQGGGRLALACAGGVATISLVQDIEARVRRHYDYTQRKAV